VCFDTYIARMPKSIQAELKQRKPFRTLEEEAFVSIARTAALIEYATAEVLRRYGLTPTQYNVLRILRGAEPKGLGRNEVRDRLIFKVSDATRLLDRLEEIGLVVRTRGEEDDRRVVVARITRKGLDLLAPLDGEIERFTRQKLGHMGERKLRMLLNLLAEAREYC
jgi:DNA-binding MarR family transcriptional regulator